MITFIAFMVVYTAVPGIFRLADWLGKFSWFRKLVNWSYGDGFNDRSN
jgi:hypothetical protein